MPTTLALLCVCRMAKRKSVHEVLYEYLQKIRVRKQKSAVRCAICPELMAGREERPSDADFEGNPASVATAMARVDGYV